MAVTIAMINVGNVMAVPELLVVKIELSMYNFLL